MARDYARISPRFWTGTTGRQIRAGGAEAQVVALYLVTGPQSNALGLYYLPLPTIQHETGVGAKGVKKALRRLEELGFAFYDQAGEVVWVPEMARHQIEETLNPKDKRVLFIAREAAKYVKSRFYPELLRRYSQAFHFGPDAPPKAHGCPSEGASETLRSQEPEPEPEPEPEHEPEHEPARSAGGLAPTDLVLELRAKASKALGRELKGAKGERLDQLIRLIQDCGVDRLVQTAVDVDRILIEKGQGPLASLGAIPGFCLGEAVP